MGLKSIVSINLLLAYCGAIARNNGHIELAQKLSEIAVSKKVEPIMVNTDKIHFIGISKNKVSIYTDKYLIEVDLETGKVNHFTR